MKVVILGATRGMGRALARLMAARGDQLCLLGRDPAALTRSVDDLSLRGAEHTPSTALCDLADADTIEPALAAADRLLDGFQIVVLSAAEFAPQAALEADSAACARLLAVNFSHTVAFCEVARKRLLSRGGGTLCVFSSVSGDRGRLKVGLYGATKAGLSHYLESLDHGYRAQGLRTVTVKPGFIHTSMNEGQDVPPFAGQPEPVARRVLKAIDRGWPVVYAPPIWSLVMLAVRLLPRAFMRRARF